MGHSTMENKNLQKITLELGEIKIILHDIKLEMDGKVLKGFDKFVFRLLGGKENATTN